VKFGDEGFLEITMRTLDKVGFGMGDGAGTMNDIQRTKTLCKITLECSSKICVDPTGFRLIFEDVHKRTKRLSRGLVV
jgi:hypothetical protein